MENPENVQETETESKISSWHTPSFPLFLHLNKMTLKITKTTKINEKMSIMYVKQVSGNKTRSLQFNISKVGLKVINSEFDTAPLSRIRLSAAFERDPDGVAFNRFCSDLSSKIVEMKDLMKNEGFNVDDFKEPVKEILGDPVIYVKVKDAELKKKLLDVPDQVECRVSIRVNCLWKSEHGTGVSLDLANFTEL